MLKMIFGSINENSLKFYSYVPNTAMGFWWNELSGSSLDTSKNSLKATIDRAMDHTLGENLKKWSNWRH